jgi:hypothetical protein
MTQDFIPYEQALDLKELGFDEPCYGFYDEFSNNKIAYGYSVGINKSPTFSQAFRWFREKYHIIGEVKFKGGKTTKTAWYDYIIYSEIDWDDKNPNEQWKKYEEAELACLIKLIEIVKTK